MSRVDGKSLFRPFGGRAGGLHLHAASSSCLSLSAYTEPGRPTYTTTSPIPLPGSSSLLLTMSLSVIRQAPRTITRLSRTALATTCIRPLSTTRPALIAPSAPMASLLQQTAQAAHSAFASLATYAQAKPGDNVPDVEVRINDLEDKINFSKLQGKNILVTVPGAFSPTCSSQVPGYISRFADFQAKGVKDIYVVAVNDIFVVNAWKAKLSGEEGKDVGVKFVADDSAALASKLGLVLDAAAIFGGPRLKRGAVVIDNGKVVSVAVEPVPSEVTVSHADEVIKTL
ncbi:Redoxin-domain-containing protein [Papiliotrema laurentii]|uniref:Redoxin-domain-containing protein n=1 Tax=Papiliotrema laurentii TaxID=5418 RepID=A0AAD9FWX8_PAPLA|nr:Redoxin-domain-containing protein [Papiliotrema laurentii]